MLPCDPNFEKVNNIYTMKQRLNIHDIQIEDPFTMKTKNDFIDSPSFGLHDIFNHLIYHATDYDKQSLAVYKSFEDYRLFQDGYVRSLETLTLREAGVHVYIGQVQPNMRAKTDDGKECYSLWFILEGQGANRGSVLDAFCKCNGGRDGGCKHIAAAMYSLDELLNPDGGKSVTSGPCLWVPRPQLSSEPCAVDQLTSQISSHHRVRRENEHTHGCKTLILIHEVLKFARVSLTKKLSEVNDSPSNNNSPSPGKPVILPLLQKLYLKMHDSSTVPKNDKVGNPEDIRSGSSSQDQAIGVMRQKVIKNSSKIQAKVTRNSLSTVYNSLMRKESMLRK